MRFQKGIGYRHPYQRPPRGPGRKQYRMSEAAYQARLSNLRRMRSKRKPDPRIEHEIALAIQRGESYRTMAKRLGCSHVHCWRVARRIGLRPGTIRPLAAPPWISPEEAFAQALKAQQDAALARLSERLKKQAEELAKRQQAAARLCDP